jgi:hypothetical protein
MSKAAGSPALTEIFVYCCAPAVVWLRDGNQVFLVDEERHTGWTLRGVEATIWDLIVLTYPYSNIVTFLSLLLCVSADEAKTQLKTTLYQWQTVGLVNIVAESENGQFGN